MNVIINVMYYTPLTQHLTLVSLEEVLLSRLFTHLFIHFSMCFARWGGVSFTVLSRLILARPSAHPSLVLASLVARERGTSTTKSLSFFPMFLIILPPATWTFLSCVLLIISGFIITVILLLQLVFFGSTVVVPIPLLLS